MRVRFSNEFGSKPLSIGAATVALSAGGAAINPSTLQVLTFRGLDMATLAPHTKLFSDPVAMQVAPGINLAISYWFRTSFTARTWHQVAEQENYLSTRRQSHARDTAGAATSRRGFPRYFLLDVDRRQRSRLREPVRSLRSGIRSPTATASTFGANMRWPDQRSAKASFKPPNIPLSVVNAGISGGRVLHDSLCVQVDSALERFPVVTSSPKRSPLRGVARRYQRHRALSPGFYGAPASCFGEDPPIQAADIIAGYQQLIADAHGAGIAIYGATVTPASFGGNPRGDARGSQQRGRARAARSTRSSTTTQPSAIPTTRRCSCRPTTRAITFTRTTPGTERWAQAIPLTLFSSAGPRRGRGTGAGTALEAVPYSLLRVLHRRRITPPGKTLVGAPRLGAAFGHVSAPPDKTRGPVRVAERTHHHAVARRAVHEAALP